MKNTCTARRINHSASGYMHKIVTSCIYVKTLTRGGWTLSKLNCVIRYKVEKGWNISALVKDLALIFVGNDLATSTSWNCVQTLCHRDTTACTKHDYWIIACNIWTWLHNMYASIFLLWARLVTGLYLMIAVSPLHGHTPFCKRVNGL